MTCRTGPFRLRCSSALPLSEFLRLKDFGAPPLWLPEGASRNRAFISRHPSLVSVYILLSGRRDFCLADCGQCAPMVSLDLLKGVRATPYLCSQNV